MSDRNEHRAETVEIPQRLLKRPMFRGMPVPYTTLVANGVPDFKTNDESKRQRCIREGLCAVCGERLGNSVAFMGGSKSLEGRLFLDPGMHRECAEYSFAVCPHYTGRTDYKDTDPSLHYANVEVTASKDVFIYICRSWQPVLLGVTLAVLAGPAKELISKRRK